MSMHWIAGSSPVGAVAVDFTSIPQTFTHLQVRLFLRDTGAFAERSWFVEVNGNSPSTSNSFHWVYGNGSTVTANSAINQGRWGEPYVPAASSTANVFGNAVLDVLDYTSTVKNKTFKAINGYDASGSGYVELSSYMYNSTSAITFLRFYTNNGFASGSRIDLYGITSSQVTGA